MNKIKHKKLSCKAILEILSENKYFYYKKKNTSMSKHIKNHRGRILIETWIEMLF